MWCQVVNELI
ncbi:unnamed protein product, partial [Allacma fusca]